MISNQLLHTKIWLSLDWCVSFLVWILVWFWGLVADRGKVSFCKTIYEVAILYLQMSILSCYT